MRATKKNQITEVKTLSAMAHPLRSRIFDLLVVDGPQTVSLIATKLGDSAGNISHHVKVMAEAGLVVEAPELARDRRERWWQLPATTVAWSNADFSDDPATEVVLEAATTLNLERQVRHVRAWNSAPRDVRRRWVAGPFSTSSWLVMSDPELGELQQELVAVFVKWRDREVPDDAVERTTCFVFAHGMPARP